MRSLANEFWWRVSLFVLVWANFLFLAILAIGFGGFLGSIDGLFALVRFWARTFPLIGLPAAAFGFAGALGWLRAHNRERATALAVLSGLAVGTYIAMLMLMRSA